MSLCCAVGTETERTIFPAGFAVLHKKKEECLVLLDWSAECSAELVLIELRLECVEVSGRVQHLVAEKLVYIAMKIIGSGLGDDVHYGARVPSVFGVEGVGQDAKFLNAVGRGLHCGQIYELIVGVSTVDAEVIGASTSAIHRHGTRLSLP